MPANETALPRTPRRSPTGTLIPTLTACTLTLGLTACTPDAPAISPTTASPAATATTPAPTATLTPTADPNPAGLAPLPADEIDASFVTIENFFKAYKYGLKTGDQSIFEAHYAPGCGPCVTLLGNIKSIAETGAHAKGGSFSFSRADLLESTAPGRVAWRLELTQHPTEFFDTDGTTTSLDGFTGPALIEVGRENTWVVTGIDTTPVRR